MLKLLCGEGPLLGESLVHDHPQGIDVRLEEIRPVSTFGYERPPPGCAPFGELVERKWIARRGTKGNPPEDQWEVDDAESIVPRGPDLYLCSSARGTTHPNKRERAPATG